MSLWTEHPLPWTVRRCSEETNCFAFEDAGDDMLHTQHIGLAMWQKIIDRLNASEKLWLACIDGLSALQSESAEDDAALKKMGDAIAAYESHRP